ncbi:MAG: YfaZ family outer membrane protein [Gammaproteobacteria bacterium]
MLRKALLSLMILAPLSNVSASGIDLRLGSKTAEIVYLTESATFGYGGADIGFGLFFNEADDFVASGSVLVSGSSAGDVRALHFGVGAKAYFGSIDVQPENLEGGALAIGGQVRYVFPASTPLAILGELFIAPSVTSVSDFEGISEYRLALELEVTPSARAYIGYRQLKVEVDNNVKLKLDDRAHVGVRFSF